MTPLAPICARALALVLCSLTVSSQLACAGHEQSAPPMTSVRAEQSATRHVVLVTIDGLMPDAYLHPDAHGLRVPTLRRFVAEGAYSDGTLSVFPSATYPAHSSIATGVTPRRHGIFANRAYDPWDKSLEAWNWYAEDLRAKPIWEALRERGLSTALVNWPVTVGAKVDYLVPEFWRAKAPEDLKLTRALSTPGLLQAAEARFPGLYERFSPPAIRDQAGTDVAVHLIESRKPSLLMLHIFEVDGAQHRSGLWTPEVIAAIENADAQLARIFAAIERTGRAAQTAVVVASDHGFLTVSRQVHPGTLLREAGLVQLDEKGRVRAWDAYALSNGGAAYVYLRDPAHAQTAERVRSLFAARAGQSGSGIARVLDREQVRAIGGDESALLALESEDGAYFGGGYGGPYETQASNLATHGWDPARPEMHASLLILAPEQPRGVLYGSRLIDIAPTIASWLRVPLPDVEGRVLGVTAVRQ